MYTRSHVLEISEIVLRRRWVLVEAACDKMENRASVDLCRNSFFRSWSVNSANGFHRLEFTPLELPESTDAADAVLTIVLAADDLWLLSLL